MQNSQDILTYCYDNYYQNNNGQTVSQVTSSHWVHFSRQNKIIKNQHGEFIIKKGIGFGNFINNTPLNKSRHLITSLLLSRYLKKFSTNPSLTKNGMEVVKRTGKLFSYDCAKQIVALDQIIQGISAFCNTTVNNLSSLAIKRVCVIGDGHGYLSSLLKLFDPKLEIITINLGSQLFFDAHQIFNLFSNNSSYRYQLLTDASTNSYACNKIFDFTFLPAENYNLLAEIPIDLFINVASMQEMKPSIINNYFKYMQESSLANNNPTYFYCLNRKHKKLMGGEEIIFDNYPWDNTEILLESTPAWCSHYPSNLPPFWRPLDGEVKEKLVVFTK